VNSVDHAVLALRRLGLRLAVLAVAAGVVVLSGTIVYIGVTAFMTQQARAFCGFGSGGIPVQALGETTVSAEQLANAQVIVVAGRRLAVPEKGMWIALATAFQESGLRNLDYGDRDSLGLFQQRPSQGWGSPLQVRDPQYAATRFYERLVEVPGWQEMPLWRAAQSVQRSAFPTAYARWEEEAADLLAEVGPAAAVDPTRGCVSVPAGSAPGFPGGPSGCVQDDPTTSGCITSVTLHALTQAENAFGGLRKGPLITSTGCFAQRPWNPTSDHPLGKGCDFFPGEGGRFARGLEIDNGWRAAEWFRVNAEALQVDYIIWQGRVWQQGVTDVGGWGRRYTGGGVYDPANAVGGHYDHFHVSFRR